MKCSYRTFFYIKGTAISSSFSYRTYESRIHGCRNIVSWSLRLCFVKSWPLSFYWTSPKEPQIFDCFFLICTHLLTLHDTLLTWLVQLSHFDMPRLYHTAHSKQICSNFTCLVTFCAFQANRLHFLVFYMTVFCHAGHAEHYIHITFKHSSILCTAVPVMHIIFSITNIYKVSFKLLYTHTSLLK